MILQSCEDEVVDIVDRPGGVAHFWDRVGDGWLERPKLPTFVEINLGGGPLNIPFAGIRCTQGDP